MTDKVKVKGLVAATFTPMHADSSVNFAMIKTIVEFLATQEIEYLYICGSTGEGPSLTLSERFKVAESFQRNCGERLKIIVNVGHNSIFEAKELARHAQELGVFAISAAVPSYYKISSVEALVAAMAEVASGAPKLPFYYYHIPILTGSEINMLDFLKIGSQTIPNLAGIKYTASTLHEFMSCVSYENGKYDILFGSDEIMLAAMTMGAKGFIGSTYNFAAPIYRKVIESFENGDLEQARLYQEAAVKLVDIIIKNNGLAAQKTMMKIIGLDCGPVRLPLLEKDQDTTDGIRREMEEIGYFRVLDQLGTKIIGQ